MRDVRALEDHRFRRELVEIRGMNFDSSVTSERVRSLLVGQKENQVRLALRGHDFRVTY